jgi:hypothetical protein
VLDDRLDDRKRPAVLPRLLEQQGPGVRRSREDALPRVAIHPRFSSSVRRPRIATQSRLPGLAPTVRADGPSEPLEGRSNASSPPCLGVERPESPSSFRRIQILAATPRGRTARCPGAAAWVWRLCSRSRPCCGGIGGARLGRVGGRVGYRRSHPVTVQAARSVSPREHSGFAPARCARSLGNARS